MWLNVYIRRKSWKLIDISEFLMRLRKSLKPLEEVEVEEGAEAVVERVNKQRSLTNVCNFFVK